MNNIAHLTYKAATLLVWLAVLPFSAGATEKEENLSEVISKREDNTSAGTKQTNHIITEKTHESIFDYKSPSLANSHFTWGAEFGASIDLGGYDMSTFDLDVVLGYKNSIFKTLGVSCGVHHDFHQGTTFVPIEAVIRTPIVPNNSLMFLNLKAGYSINTVGDAPTRGGFIFNTGVGFNLFTSRSIQTHLLLSYQFIHLNEAQGDMIDKSQNHANMIQIGFGLNF